MNWERQKQMDADVEAHKDWYDALAEVEVGGDGESHGDDTEHYLHLGQRWGRKAEGNVEEWGQQSPRTLLLAAQEELGELTQAVLEAEAERGDPEQIQSELNDLAALMFQLQWAINDKVDR